MPLFAPKINSFLPSLFKSPTATPPAINGFVIPSFNRNSNGGVGFEKLLFSNIFINSNSQIFIKRNISYYEPKIYKNIEKCIYSIQRKMIEFILVFIFSFYDMESFLVFFGDIIDFLKKYRNRKEVKYKDRRPEETITQDQR